MSQSKVVIVGAGLAGLSCAVRLHKSGVPFQIFEKGNSIGGRVSTENYRGFLLDRGFQVLLTSYPDAEDILDYKQLDLCPFEPGALIRYDGEFHRFVDPWRRPSGLLATAVSPVASLADKLRIGLLRRRVCRGTLEKLYERPETSTIQLLRASGFSDRILECFFRPFLGGVFLERELETSSRKFEFVFRMFSTGDAVLPRNGMSEIARQLANHLPKESIQTNCPVHHVFRDSVVLSDGQLIDAEKVVLACDQVSAFRLIGKQTAPESHAVNCHYYSADDAAIKEPILVLNGDGSGPINNLCVPSQISPAYSPEGKALISVTTLPTKESDRGSAEPEVRKQLQAWFGRQVVDWELLKTIRVPSALPRQNDTDLSPVSKAIVQEDGMYVCGDYLEIASIQGALASGRRVAEHLIDAMNEAT